MIASSSSTANRGQYLQYINKYCYCGYTAEIKVSNTTNNPKHLFYTYKNRACTFFLWCDPIDFEGVQGHNIQDDVTNEDTNLGQQLKDINMRLKSVEQVGAVLKFAVFSMAFYMFFYLPKTNI